jgi:KWG Leptospira.
MGKQSMLFLALILILIGTFGIANAEEMKVNQAYDKVLAFSDDGYALVQKDKKWGIIDKTGKEIVSPSFSSISGTSKSLFVNGFAYVRHDDQSGFMDKSGNIIFERKDKEVIAGYFSDGLAAIRINDKYGYIDTTGKTAINVQYDSVTNFSNGVAIVRSAGKSSLIDKTGNIISDLPPYEPFFRHYISNFHEGLASVKMKKKYGYIDEKGSEIIKPQYDIADDFSEGLALVGNKVKGEEIYSFINKTGQVVINFPEKSVRGLFGHHLEDSDVYDFELKDDFSFEDSELITITAPKDVKKFKRGQDDTLMANLYKKDGTFLSSFPITNDILIIGAYKEGLAPYAVKKQTALDAVLGLSFKARTRAGFIDEKGNKVIDSIYNEAKPFHEGLALVKRDKKWGYINKNGQEVIPIQFDEGTSFNQGVAPVKLNGAWSLIDKTGQIVASFGQVKNNS